MDREMICISCPLGCRLTVKWEPSANLTGEDINVEGNRCVRGDEYGKEEILAPKRVVTATCAINSNMVTRIPVKTRGPLIKEQIKPLLEHIYELRLHPPIELGGIVIENFKNTGIDLVATRSVYH